MPAVLDVPRSIDLSEYGHTVEYDLTTAQIGWLIKQSPFVRTSPTFDGGVKVQAEGTIGTLLGEGLRVHIAPKVPLRNLFEMLTYAYDVPEFRKQVDQLRESDTLFDFVVTMFRKNVDQLVRQGIYRAYINDDIEHSHLRGRLLVATQLRRPSVITRFAQRISDLTANVLENQILQHTLWRLSRVPSLAVGEKRALRRASAAFAQVNPVPIRPIQCDGIVYHRLNQRYHLPIRLARLLLEHLAVESGEGRHPFATYMLPMAQVFERFVGRYLQVHLPPDWSATLQEAIAIDEDGTQKGYPDIVIRHNGAVRFIIDTKYKRWHGTANDHDRNQQFIYCRRLSVRRAVLLYPEPLDRPYAVSLPDGVTLAAAGIDLSGDLLSFRRACQALIGQLLNEYSSG